MERGESDLHQILRTYESDIPLYVLSKFWYQILLSVNYIHENGKQNTDYCFKKKKNKFSFN